jgi:hypothetical protein
VNVLSRRSKQWRVGRQLTHYRVCTDQLLDDCENIIVLVDAGIGERLSEGERHVVSGRAPILQVPLTRDVSLE